MLFSVVVVALNPGEKLKKTLDSILKQKYSEYEIILKDGLSKDGSAEAIEQLYAAEKRLKIYRTRDKGIYDAMNQALGYISGDYVLFLNCGDTLYCDTVLGDVAAMAEKKQKNLRYIFYGDTYSEKAKALITSAPKITGFTCYRNIPCHQSCFYDARLFAEKQYSPAYHIRADYDHFLWCFYRGDAHMVHLETTVASYEGGGYSESRENRARDQEEHRLITREYMKRGELFGYRLLMVLSLAPLRRWMAENKVFSGVYQQIKKILYHRK